MVPGHHRPQRPHRVLPQRVLPGGSSVVGFLGAFGAGPLLLVMANAALWWRYRVMMPRVLLTIVGGTGQAAEGVTAESMQAEAHRFLRILWLGHGERPAHCCSSLAMKEAA
ncbi:hypothetical protein EYF80_052235 [Liparis tanakae]|uniref:Uncharacterized protein n=1 Tax=Liparis tanakae TaxID=230148 RepID=A0A4Z2F9W9_9TELE|nr:hypothetical protein EYF80_052235 [Liparis tanakae]